MDDDIYDEYAIIEEKTIEMTNYDRDFTFGDLTTFAALEFVRYSTTEMTITDIGNASQSANAEPLAQIVFWQWNRGTPEIEKKMLLNTGGTIHMGAMKSKTSVIVRILKKRALNETPCPPIFSPNDDLSVQIGDHQITVSAHWLLSDSPVVNRMLSVEMKEKRERTLNLDGLGIEMEQFNAFLEAISRPALRNRTLPNPKNVVNLLKLADYFQVDWLKERCEAHLIHCVEIPAIERFQLIERYQLNKLKQYFMRCFNCPNVDQGYNLRAFFKANLGQLMADGFISKELLSELILKLLEVDE